MTEDIREQYSTMHTVADLRAMLKEYYGITPGSKVRKAELIDLLFAERTKRQAELPVAVVNDAPVTDAELQDFIGDVMSTDIQTVQLLGQGLHDLNGSLTAAERQELNEAKYRGRYAGKSAVVQIRKRTVLGTVADRVHRGAELLLVLRHAEDAGHPRVTLHRAEDILV
jgi:hypothetical protein